MITSDIAHAASTYGVEVTSDITHDSEQNVWKFKGVNYREAESTAKDYIAYREEGYSGIRIRQIRPRTAI